MPQWEILYVLFLKGVSVGLLAALAAGVLRGPAAGNVRLATLLVAVSGIAYCVDSSGLFLFAGEPFPRAGLAISTLGLGVIGFVWLFVAAVFDDWPVNGWTVAPAVVLIALGAAEGEPARLASLYGVSISHPAFYLMTGVGGLLALHAIYLVIRGWRGDLVEARRRLRGPLLVIAIVANLYILWQVVLAYAPVPTGALPAIDIGNAATESVWMLAAAAVLLQGRAALLAASPSARASDNRAEAVDKAALQALDRLMIDDQAWRREGLTIGGLASEIGVSEQRLRRLINGRLGHRNFAAFVNAYRIEAAKQRLADPGRVTVAEIAFDLGFSSLGPFNRAFKEAVGVTPTAWRRSATTAADEREAA